MLDLGLPASSAVRGQPSRLSPFPSLPGPHQCPSVGILASPGRHLQMLPAGLPTSVLPPAGAGQPSRTMAVAALPWPAPYSAFLCQQAVRDDFCRCCSCYPFFSLPFSFPDCIPSKLLGPGSPESHLHLHGDYLGLTSLSS